MGFAYRLGIQIRNLYVPTLVKVWRRERRVISPVDLLGEN